LGLFCAGAGRARKKRLRRVRREARWVRFARNWGRMNAETRRARREDALLEGGFVLLIAGGGGTVWHCLAQFGARWIGFVLRIS
jgi:hypothetical protein